MIDFIIIAYVSTKCKGYSGEIEGIWDCFAYDF